LALLASHAGQGPQTATTVTPSTVSVLRRQASRSISFVSTIVSAQATFVWSPLSGGGVDGRAMPGQPGGLLAAVVDEGDHQGDNEDPGADDARLDAEVAARHQVA